MQPGREYQQYPAGGTQLGERQDWTLERLRQSLTQGDLNAPAYSYVLTSVHLETQDGAFRQYGSAPNFQGGRMTLCTCKHRMRTYHDAPRWKSYWIAGFSGKNETTRGNALFYLMKVGEAYDSHSGLWRALTDDEKSAKVAGRCRLGDVYEPKNLAEGIDEFDPDAYKSPATGHVHEDCWGEDVKKDERYREARPPVLLVGDPGRSFLWSRPKVFYDAGGFGEEHHPRDNHKWTSLTELWERLTS